MIKSDNTYKVCIDITTFKAEQHKDTQKNNMTTVCSNKKSNKCHDKFICSICLNQNAVSENTGSEFNERKSKSCPICHSCDFSEDDSTVTKKSVQKSNNNTTEGKRMKLIAKNIQTSEPDVVQGLSLLNEVLSAFQSKKQIGNRKSSGRTLIYKDVGISTDDVNFRNVKPKLTLNKVYQFSINDINSSNDNNFTIVSSCQPEIVFGSHNSVDLIKHKSSSIPQMKLEELKNSLKEKTKSKDAVEEVQRMFATVKRIEPKDSVPDINRPMVRNGPRVLPVVKTANFEVKTENDKSNKSDQKTCKCNKNNYYMSSGDSSVKQKCCHSCDKCVERCDDCVYMLCHYKENQKEFNELICKRCRTKKGLECRHRCS